MFWAKDRGVFYLFNLQQICSEQVISNLKNMLVVVRGTAGKKHKIPETGFQQQKNLSRSVCWLSTTCLITVGLY